MLWCCLQLGRQRRVPPVCVMSPSPGNQASLGVLWANNNKIGIRKQTWWGHLGSFPQHHFQGSMSVRAQLRLIAPRHLCSVVQRFNLCLNTFLPRVCLRLTTEGWGFFSFFFFFNLFVKMTHSWKCLKSSAERAEIRGPFGQSGYTSENQCSCWARWQPQL